MMAERLLEHFATIENAPGAISRLRRFVLDLAVRGKLVSQDPNDECASELLKRIAIEKARLVKAGQSKSGKPIAPADDEAEFDIPPIWRWTRLGAVTSYIQRGKSPKYATSGGSPVVSQKCVQWSGLDLTVAKRVTLASLAKYENIRFLRDGDLLWNSTGTGTIGRVIRLANPPQQLVCDSHVTVVRCSIVDPEYIRIWLRSDHVYALIEDRASGSTNQVELTAQMAANQVVPLPPLAEQHRIVAKVRELMALCDKLEVAKVEREAVRGRLVTGSLARVTQRTDDAAPKERNANVHFVLGNLPALTVTPQHIKQLRQTILGLGVRGRLVPQDARDGPAPKFDEIDVPESKHPFKIPPSWVWARLHVIGNLKGGGTPSKTRGEFWNGTIPWVSPKDMKVDYIADAQLHISEAAIDNSACKIVEVGSVLFVVRGMILAHSFPIAVSQVPLAINQDMKALELKKPEMANFILRALKGLKPQVLSRVQRSSHGTCRLEAEDYADLPIPIPPFAEQRRIVGKVDELMLLCDQLETKIVTGRDISRRLLEAVLHEALTPIAVNALKAAE